jgi:REP-associated tyrosine transposase
MCSAIAGGRRRSIRLSWHDYAGHAGYLVTLCIHNRTPLLGKVVETRVELSSVGQLIHDLWIITPQIRPGVTLDAFIVMPDHFHAIVFLPSAMRQSSGFSCPARPPRSLGSLIAGYKSACTSRVNALLGTKGLPVWQRNYHERVIRDARALLCMRRYIAANPARWGRR